jgi:adenylate cyclase class IV
MHAKAHTIVDPIENLDNFAEIQVEDDNIDAMDENNIVVKTTLQQFYPIV